MRPLSMAVLALLAHGARSVQAQEVIPDVEYMTGRGGFADRIKGQLILTDTAVVFVTKQGSNVFTVPVSTIRDVTQNVSEDPGSTGRKLLLGVFANRREEYVYIGTETAETAEGIVFKAKKNTSLGIVNKIKLLVRRAGGTLTTTPAP